MRIGPWSKLTPKELSLKRRARQKLCYAVVAGRIKKPDSCSRCGTTQPKHMIDGHHHNGYEAWDDVVWLCKRCHAEVDEVKRVRYGNESHTTTYEFKYAYHHTLQRTPKASNTTGYTGITKNTGRGRPWIARITKDGVCYSLGCFDSIEEAIAARRRKAKELYPPILHPAPQPKAQ